MRIVKFESKVCRSAKEEVIGYVLAELEPEARRDVVEIDARSHALVQAAEIDRQVSIHEHPHVVVALEREHLSTERT